MKYNLFKGFLVLTGLILFSCSKEDPISTPVQLDGGQVSRYQIVTIDLGGTLLSNSTYSGTFNNQSITLGKVDDHILSFYVNETTPLGMTELNIPELNNTKIIYEVVDIFLTQTPAETLQPLLNFQAEYGTTLTNDPEDAPFLQNHNSITTYIENLTGDDAIIAAKFYKANKTIFDAVYNTNYDAIQGRSLNQTQADFDFQLYRSLILRHKLAVVVTVVAGVIAVIPPYDFVKTPIAAAVALAGIHKSSSFHDQITTDVFRVVGIKLNNQAGDNTPVANMKAAPLILSDNQAVTLPFTVNAKNFANTDNGIQKEFVQKFFTSKNSLNDLINKVNTAINWVNDNVPLLTLNNIGTVNVPNTTPVNAFNANTPVMQRFTFSVNHPNLSLVTAALSGTGQLNLKIKYIGNPTTTPINSTLNYTYNDDFSSFSGSFPIQVTNSFSLVGTWNMESFDNGVPVGQYVNQYPQECPTIPIFSSTILSASFVFTSNTYVENGSQNQINLNKSVNTTTCTVTNDDPDTQVSSNYSTNGTYTLNGTNIEFIDSIHGLDVVPLEIITNNKIKIYDEVYVRQ